MNKEYKISDASMIAGILEVTNDLCEDLSEIPTRIVSRVELYKSLSHQQLMQILRESIEQGAMLDKSIATIQEEMTLAMAEEPDMKRKRLIEMSHCVKVQQGQALMVLLTCSVRAIRYTISSREQ